MELWFYRSVGLYACCLWGDRSRKCIAGDSARGQKSERHARGTSNRNRVGGTTNSWLASSGPSTLSTDAAKPVDRGEAFIPHAMGQI